MLLNADLEIRTLAHAADMDWTASPMPGVERRMLFRIGEEKARATSIVRYAPGSQFSRHGHPGGEEILVLEGTFRDETGDFPAGSYIRNPPGTGHAPGSETGCTILVKLWQFSMRDADQVVCKPGEGVAVSLRPGAGSARLLFEGQGEHVLLEEWNAGAEIVIDNPQGLELLVLEGTVDAGNDTLRAMSWLRLPAGEPLRGLVGRDGAKVWLKTGPLLHEDACPFGYDAFDPVI